MVNVSNESKVGIFTIVSLIILILGFNFLKGKNIFASSDTYYAAYDNAANISASNPVLLQGYKVGNINYIRAVQRGKTKIIISIAVKKGLKIPAHSRAKIVSTDITGSKAIQLIFSDSKTFLNVKDTLIGETEVSLTEAVDKIISPIEKKLNDIMARLQLMLDEEGVDNLKATFANLKLLTQNLNTLTSNINNSLANDRLGKILARIDNITKTLEENRNKINNALTNFDNISDSLKAAPIAQTIKKINILAGNIDLITAKINKGEGSLGMLVNNDSLYNNLQSASFNLNKLVVDLKEHPGRYVHVSVFGGGKKDK